jgi:hypothetical protein
MARSQIVTFGDKSEKSRRKDFFRFFKKWPIPDEEFFLNLGLFLTPQTLSRILFMDFLYRQILGVWLPMGSKPLFVYGSAGNL